MDTWGNNPYECSCFTLLITLRRPTFVLVSLCDRKVFGTWVGWTLLSYYAMFHFVSWHRKKYGNGGGGVECWVLRDVSFCLKYGFIFFDIDTLDYFGEIGGLFG